ncbi:MAG: hypothetical protein ILP11_01055 [Alphaproteobacteria bacterium]|nr:hypothetical protein [Alphaproteobacteria bacterium]
MKKFFCIYTACIPVILEILFLLNQMFGIVCVDGCSGHSYATHIAILYLFGIVAVTNILLLVLAFRHISAKVACLFMVILNCLSCFFMWIMSATLMASVIFGIPAMVVTVIQSVIGTYILLKEIFHIKRAVLLSFLGLLAYPLVRWICFKILFAFTGYAS